MAQQNSFLETMHSHSSDRLKEIVEQQRGDYQPEAIAAAEQILRKRNIKFKEPEPDENVEMTYEEIREDIRKRRVKGQSMSSIRAYYKECGVDIDMPEIKRGEEPEPSKPLSFREIRVLVYALGGMAAVFVNVQAKGWNGAATIITVITLVPVAIWAMFRYWK